MDLIVPAFYSNNDIYFNGTIIANISDYIRAVL